MMTEIRDYNALRAAIRRMCAALEAQSVPEDAVFGCKLVADELISNALRYGGGIAFFSAECSGEEVVIKVRGATEFCPPQDSRCSGVDCERGRGLYLVDAYSAARAYSPKEGIRVVIRIRERS